MMFWWVISNTGPGKFINSSILYKKIQLAVSYWNKTKQNKTKKVEV